MTTLPQSLRRLPLTIVSGYLGAGKTTLINRLLAGDHGQRVMVIVNDFGAINIDAALIESAGDTTLELSNGCICCTMEADLFMALNAALDRDPRPDHLIVEASGIADPAAIAQAALAEKDIGYAGILTLVDGENAPALLDDPATAPQLAQQIAAADMVLVTKARAIGAGLADRLNTLGARQVTLLDDTPPDPLIFDLVPLPKSRARAPHPAYARWSHDSARVIGRAAMGALLENRPAALYRLKGFVLTDDGAYEVHVVGRHVSARRTRADRTALVGLGLAARITPDEIEAWWQSGTSG